MLRLELLAQAGRCAEALQMADGVADEARLSNRERALFTRAGCRRAVRDDSGCVADLERYLAEFPAGRFAAKARAALGK